MFKETSNGGQSPLHIAASKGQTDVIKTIFDSATKEQKTELSMHRDMYGNTATALAAFHGHVDTVRYILNILQPATIYEMLNEMSNGGKSTLHIAASKGHTDVIKTIIDSATEEQIIELSVHRDIDGNATTDLAAFHGHAETVRSILDILHPNRRYEMLKEMSNAGQSILHIAASKGETDVIKAVSEFVTEDQRFELSMRQNMYGYTASALAAFHGHTETVRYRLDILQQDSRYEVLKEKNEDGKSSLHIAASKGKTNVIKTIFESVTDEQMHDLLMLQDSNGDTAIISAAFDGHANTARYLLHAVNSDTRYEMLKVTNMKERTALHIAASEGDTTFLRTITDSLSIAEIHHLLMHQENDGNTAIALASIRGHTTTVEFLLNCIQDSGKKYEMLKVSNMQGQTTVHSAALKGHTDVLTAILKSVSNAQIYNLLMSQMDSSGYIARAFPDQLGRYAKNSGKVFAKMAQCSSSDFEPSATFEQETEVPDHSRTGIRQREEYAHGRGIECLNCKELEEEVQQLRFHQDSLNVLQNERELLVVDQAAEIKQLTNQTRILNIQNSKLTYQMVTQSRHVEELTMKVEELTKKVVDQHRKLAESIRTSNQYEADKNELRASLKEKELLLQFETAQNKQLTNQVESFKIQTSQLTNQMESLKDQTSQLTNQRVETTNKCRQTTDGALGEEGSVQLQLSKEGAATVTSKEGTATMTSNEGTATMTSKEGTATMTSKEGTATMTSKEGTATMTSKEGTATMTSKDEDQSESEASDDGYIVIHKDLVLKLKQFCEEHSIHDGRVYQHPYDCKDISVIGTGAFDTLTEPLKAFLKENKEFDEFTVNAYDPDNEMETQQFHIWQKALNFESDPSYAMCELIVQAGDSPRKVYVLGPAHMLFCETANKKFQSENCDIDEIRNIVRKDPPQRHMKIHHKLTEVKVEIAQTPLIGYRYRYPRPPPSDKQHKLYTNDCVLYELDPNEAKDLERDLRDANPYRYREIHPVNAIDQLQEDHLARRKIAVQKFYGHLYPVDVEDNIRSCRGVHLHFTITLKNENGDYAKLVPGDSSSIVYYVDKETDGRRIHRPWGMLVGSGHIKGAPIYHAVVLHQVFKDIEEDYELPLGDIRLLEPTG